MNIEELFDNQPDDGVEVFLDGSCEECYSPYEKMFYKSDTQMLTSYCDKGHRVQVKANLDWLFRG